MLHHELFQHASDIKIKKIKVINMVSIKIKNHNIHWNIFPFSQNTLQQKIEKIDQIISQISSKDIPNKKLSKKSTKISLMPYLTILSQVCSSKIYIGSQKVVAIWQHLIVNRQRLTPCFNHGWPQHFLKLLNL